MRPIPTPREALQELAGLADRLRSAGQAVRDAEEALRIRTDARNALIVQAVDEAGISQAEVAALIGVSQPHVNRILRQSQPEIELSA